MRGPPTFVQARLRRGTGSAGKLRTMQLHMCFAVVGLYCPVIATCDINAPATIAANPETDHDEKIPSEDPTRRPQQSQPPAKSSTIHANPDSPKYPQAAATTSHHAARKLQTTHKRTSSTRSRCSKFTAFVAPPTDVPPTVKITSNSIPTTPLSPLSNNPIFPSPEELNSLSAASSSSNQRFSTVNISSQGFPFVTTDSQPRWLPSSSSSLPAPPHSHPQQPPQTSPPDLPQASQQDFVLYERSHSARAPPRLSQSQGLTATPRRHSSHYASATSLQNQRVAAIIQATGHPISTSAFTNRFHPSAQNPHRFYASSAPSSSAALNQQRQLASHRPQVPLFSQSNGNNQIPQTPNMALQGNFVPSLPSCASSSSQARSLVACYSHNHPADMDLFDDFTAFEGGASTQNAFHSAYSSPAVPTIYDIPMNNSTASSTTNTGTVSPQDLLVRDPFASAPNSTAFTNLTSPSTYNESPEYNDNFDVSPFINNSDLDNALSGGAGDPWYPLFPQEEQMAPATASSKEQEQESPLLPEEELEVSEQLRSSATRRRSGTGNSSPPSASHAAHAGVNSRKRDKPLPPIIVEDPNDTVAMKRARNTLAARKSRQRKMERFEELEERISKLEAERDHWKNIALRRGGGQ
ncbi:hypothetical protein B7463_g47, partial [Scytalidium lignicola]